MLTANVLVVVGAIESLVDHGWMDLVVRSILYPFVFQNFNHGHFFFDRILRRSIFLLRRSTTVLFLSFGSIVPADRSSSSLSIAFR